MSYQISKYDAIKAVLMAEECNDDKLAAKIQQIIQRATNYEIKRKTYTKVYIITEKEKKRFEQVPCRCTITAVEDNG